MEGAADYCSASELGVQVVEPQTQRFGGRPPAPVRQYFTSSGAGSSKDPATCNFCSKLFPRPRSHALVQHIASGCDGAPEHIKAGMIAAAANKQARSDKSSKPSGPRSDAEGVEPHTHRGGGRPPAPVRQYFTSTGAGSSTDPSTCNFCGKLFQSPRSDALVQHIASGCSSAPDHVKASVVAAATAAAASKQSLPLKRAKSSGPPNSIVPSNGGGSSSSAINRSKAVQQPADEALLLWMVCSGISFHVANSPHFRSFVQLLNPLYSVPDEDKLSGPLLTDAYTRVKMADAEARKGQVNMSLLIDGWSHQRPQSLFGATLKLQDGSIQFLRLIDVSVESPTSDPAEICEVLKTLINDISGGDPSKVAYVVSGQANLTAARRKLVEQPGYTHILESRCMLHAFSLVLQSLLSHDHARSLLARAQKVATYVRASPLLQQCFEASRKSARVGVTLATAGKTHISSVCELVSTLLQNQHVLVLAVQDVHSRGGAVSPEVLSILENVPFWQDLTVLGKLLAPFQTVRSGIQSNQTQLADCVRYWLYLARGLRLQRSSLPEAFYRHSHAVFIKHWREMDGQIARLALFLDPRYKSTVVVDMAELCITAARLMQRRRHGAAFCARLTDQLIAFSVGDKPFDLPCTLAIQPLAWWRALAKDSPAWYELLLLVELLYGCTPHAAQPERLFSMLGWFDAPTRSRLASDKLEMMAAIRCHHRADSTGGPDLLQEQDELTAEELDAGLLAAHQQEFQADGPQPGSMVDLLVNDDLQVDGFNLLSPALASDYVPAVSEVQLDSGLGEAADAEPFDVASLVRSQLGCGGGSGLQIK